jgi:hypothetical protein
MSDQEVSRTFPDSEEQGLEADAFRTHLSESIDAYLEASSATTLKTTERVVYQVNESGIYSGLVSFPEYRSWELEDARLALRLPKVAGLLQYIWDRGGCRRTLRGVNPDRQAWELFTLHDVIHTPLSMVLTEAAVEEAVDSGKITLWRLTGEFKERMIEELTLRHCAGVERYAARCPLGWIAGEPGDEWSLGDGIVLKRCTARDHAIYLTRSHYRLLWHDALSSLVFDVGLLEITIKVPTGSKRMSANGEDDTVEEAIADTLDSVKWALVQAVPGVSPLVEGTVTYDDFLGGSAGPAPFGSFRRQDADGGSIYKLTAEALNIACELIADALKYRRRSEDLHRALWHWGRACVAKLGRDRVLESAIGLEGLLVQSPGESTYKFALHGAALLSMNATEAEVKSVALRAVYRQRSAMAHGSGKKSHEEYSAHSLLGEAIASVVALMNDGMLSTDKQIAKQIEGGVLRMSVLRKRWT